MPVAYATQSATSDPGASSALLDATPTDLASVAAITQGLVFHYAAGKFMFGHEPAQERIAEIDTRDLKHILARITELDARPLNQARDFDKRIIGCCRDFSLIACAILRHHNIPARLRYGFASYFEPNYWIDHVIVETWTEGRWQRFDPQMAGIIHPPVDLFDIPGDAFITGGRAWQLCRSEGADPTRFGLGPFVPEVSGLWFVRGRLLLDLASLNKQEMLCWDEWSYGVEAISLTDEDIALLDRVAQLSQLPESAELTALYQTDERLRVPNEVLCYSPAIGPHTVHIN